MSTTGTFTQWKSSIEDIDIAELKSVRVKIRRPYIPQLDVSEPIMRGLDDPKSLVIHLRPDIKVNQCFPEERTIHLTSGYKRSRSRERKRSCSSSSSYSSNDEHKKLYRNKSKKYRSPSRSPSRHRSSVYHRSRSRSNSSPAKNNEKSPKKNRQRSTSKEPQKIPGCYIPTKKELEEARERAKRRRELMGIHSERRKSRSRSNENESNSYGERKDKRSPRRRSGSFSPQRRRRRSRGSDSDDGRHYDRRRNRRGEEIISYEKNIPPYYYPYPEGDENYWAMSAGPMPGPATYVSSSFFPYMPRPIRPPGIPLFPRMPVMMHPPHLGMRQRLPVYNRPYRPPSIRPALSETEKPDETARITELDNKKNSDTPKTLEN